LDPVFDPGSSFTACQTQANASKRTLVLISSIVSFNIPDWFQNVILYFGVQIFLSVKTF